MGNRINDPVTNGVTPTDNKGLSTKQEPPLTFGINAAKTGGKIMTGTGIKEPLNPEYDSFKRRLPGSEGISTPREAWYDTRTALQSNWEQLGNATARTVLNTIPEIVKQGSQMLDFSDDYESNNFVAQAMIDLQGEVNKITPIFRENPETAMDFGDFAYWMEQGSSLVQSAAAFAALGYMTGGAASGVLGAAGKSIRVAGRYLGTARKAEQVAQMGAQMGQVAEAATIGNKVKSVGTAVTEALSKTLQTRNLAGLTNAYALNKAESMGVAVDTWQSTYDKSIAEQQAKNDGSLTADQMDANARKEASEAAAYAYRFNQVNIALNVSSAFSFLKPGVAGFRQQLADVGFKAAAGKVALESGQEAIEEAVNYVAQKRAEAGDGKLSLKDQLTSALTNGVQDALTDEGKEAMFWGAIGGAAQTGFTKAGHFLNIQKNEAYDLAYKNAFSEIKRNNKDLTNAEIDEQAKKIAEQKTGSADKRTSINKINQYKNAVLEEERAKIKDSYGIQTDADGEAYTKIKESSMLFNTTQDLLDLDDKIAEAEDNNDLETARDLASRKIDYQILHAIRTGTLNTLEDTIKTYKDLPQDQAIKLGLAKDETDIQYKQQADKALQRIKDYENIAAKNQGLVNSDTITDLDLAIYQKAERAEILKKEVNPLISSLLATKRENYFANFTNNSFVPYVSDDYFKKSYEQRQEEYRALAPAQKSVVTSKTKELEDGVQLDADDIKTLPKDIQDKYEFLKKLDTEIEAHKAERDLWASEDMQSALKQAQDEARYAAKEEARAAKEQDKQKKARDKATAAQAETIAKTVKKDNDTPPQAPPATSETEKPEGNESSKNVNEEDTKQDTKDEKSTLAKGEVTEEGVTITIANDAPPKQAPITVVTTADALLEKFSEDTNFKLKEDDFSQSTYIAIRNTIMALAATLDANAIIDTEKINRNMLIMKNDIPSMLDFVEDYFTQQKLREYSLDAIKISENILSTYQLGTSVVEGVAAAQDLESPVGEDNEDANFEDLSEEDPVISVDLDKTITDAKKIENAILINNRFQSLIQAFNSLGLPTNTYNQFEANLTKILDRELLVKLTPEFIRLWNATMDIANTPGAKVDPSRYSLDHTLSEREYAKKRAEGTFWSATHEEQIGKNLKNMVNDANTMAGSPITVIETSSKGRNRDYRKSTTSMNIAYLAKFYDVEVDSVSGLSIVKVKQDLEGLNDFIDKRLITGDNFDIGTEFKLSPLKKHKYYNSRTGNWEMIIRDKKDPTKVRIYKYSKESALNTDYAKPDKEAPTLYITREPIIADAVNHLPIAIKDKNNKTIVGAFLHIPEWVTTDNVAGTSAKVEEERQWLISIRESVINNKGNLLTAKITAVSDGVLLTDNKDKTVNTISSTGKKPGIALLRSNTLMAGGEQAAEYDNKVNTDNYNDGAVFMIVKNGKKNYAIPVRKKPLNETNNGDVIVNSIASLLDLHFTDRSQYTDEQKALAKMFKLELQISPNNIKQVAQYIKKFIYVDKYKANSGFAEYVNNLSEDYEGASIFNYAYDSSIESPVLDFSIIGTGVTSITRDNYSENRTVILDSLKNALNNAYMNTDITFFNGKSAVKGINENNEVVILGDNYKDFLGNSLYTNVAPAIVEGKEIYTIQRTFTLSAPLEVAIPAKEPIADKESISSVAEVTNDVKEEISDELSDLASSILDNINLDLDSPVGEDATDANFGTDSESILGTEVSNEIDEADKPSEFKSLYDSYNFIKGVDSKIVNTVFEAIRNEIEKHILVDKTDYNINDAFDKVFNDIKTHVERTIIAPNAQVLAMTPKNDAEREKIEQIKAKLAPHIERYNNIINNKEKFKTRIIQVLTKQRIITPLKGEALAEYKKNVKAKLLAEQEERKKIAKEQGIEIEEVIIYDPNDVQNTSEGEQEYKYDLDALASDLEIDDYTRFDKDGIFTDSFNAANAEIKNFFRGIKSMKKNKNGEIVPEINFLGLPVPVDVNEAYTTVQSLLANYQNQYHKKPDYKNFVRILKSHITTKPFLHDVVTKLDKDVTEGFKNAFVANMTKQYNNTSLVVSSINGTTKLISSDSANYARLLIKNWSSNFDASNKYSVNAELQDAEKTINPNTLYYIEKRYNQILEDIKFKRFRSDNGLIMIKEIFDELGINIKDQFYEDLNNGAIEYTTVRGDTNYYSVKSFATSSMFKYAIGSIVGNAELGLPPINNLFASELFGDPGFMSLAKIASTYEPNLYGSSSRDIENNLIYNYSEMKNLVDAFFKNRDDATYIKSTLDDPYRDIRKNFDDKKPYKTWLEQLFISTSNGMQLNRATVFSDNFEYVTFNGVRFETNKGKVAVPINKLSELGTLKTHFNLYMNGNAKVQSQHGDVHIGYLPFFTMSDKKIPMLFKVPLYKFGNGVLNEKYIDDARERVKNGSTKDVEYIEDTMAKRQLIFNTLIKPELNRIVEFNKANKLNETNIDAYKQENLKFYGLPFLNDIDFDYIDGDKSKGLDTEGKLKARLELGEGINYTMPNPNPDKTHEKLINPLALENNKVQQFLLEKVIAHLNTKVADKIEEFLEMGLIRPAVDSPGNYVFVENSGVDIRAAKGFDPQRIDEEVVANTHIMNFVLNTELGYANMQQLLVGDPIQFAKTGKSASIAKDLRKAHIELEAAQNAANEKDLKGQKVSQNDLEEIEKLVNKVSNLQRAYEKQWAYGDAKTSNDNEAKRLAGDNASGEMIVPVNGKTHFNLAVFKDIEMSTNYFPQYRQWYLDAGYSEEDVEKFLKDYKAINTADAQEIVTLKEHLDIMFAQNLISKEDIAKIIEADNKEELDLKTFSEIIAPMKLVYSNTFMRDKVNSRLYIKSSSFPLTKTFTKGLPIDELRKFMEKPDNNIDRIAFESAVKVGANKDLPSVFKSDGSIDLSSFDKDKHIIKVPREGHKKQLNVPYDESKTKISDGTQKSKGIFTDLYDVPGFVNPLTGRKNTGRELYEGEVIRDKDGKKVVLPSYMSVFQEYYRTKFFKLKDRIFKNDVLQIPELHNLLMEEAISRGYSQNEMEFLKMNEAGDSFDYPLWLSSNSLKIEALLNSIVDNNVRKRKRRGVSKVLVSDSLLDISSDALAKGSNIVFVKGHENRTEGLRPMRIDPDTGEILPAEIVITFPFRDQNGQLLDVNDFVKDGVIDPELLPDDVLEGLGFRIPTQGINSMSNVKIVGFLPASIDNVAFVPRDFVTQMGSDFDVDKINIDLYNTVYSAKNKSLRRINSDDTTLNKKQREYLKTKARVDSLQRNNEKLANKETSAAKELYAKNVKDINRLLTTMDKMRGDLDQADFLDEYYDNKDLLVHRLEDQILDIQRAVLSNPSPTVQAKRIQPIDNASLLIIKDIIDDITPDDVDVNWTPYDHTYQMQKYIGAKEGKSAVSAFSSDSVINVLFQSIKEPVHFTYVDYETKVVRDKKYTLFGRQSNSLNSSKKGKLYNTDKLTKKQLEEENKIKYKSDFIQALQSIGVDNQNMMLMDKMNMNEFTFDFIRAAVFAGFTEHDVLYLINHPVIKRYVRARVTENKFEAPLNYVVEKDAEGKTKNVYYTNAQYDAALKNLTHDEVREDIKLNKDNDSQLNNAAIYYIFTELSERGKHIKQLEGLANIDSKGLGSNLLFSLKKEKAINELRTNTSIRNAFNLIGSHRPLFAASVEGIQAAQKRDGSEQGEEIYKEKEKQLNSINAKDGYIKTPTGWFKPTTIVGMNYWYALTFNNRINSQLLPYNNDRLLDITGTVLNLQKNKDLDLFGIEKDLIDEQAAKSSRKRDTVVSTSPTTDSDIEAKALTQYKAFLFSAIAGIYDTTASNIRKELLEDNTLAFKLADIKSNSLLPNNRLIQKINIDDIGDGKATVMNITYTASSQEIFDEDSLVMDIINLLESEESVKLSTGEELPLKELGTMLIQHQLVTSGIQQAQQFIKHIPVRHLKNIGLYDYIQNLNGEVNDIFLEQYIQHNPELVFSDSLTKEINNKNGLYKVENNIITMTNAVDSDSAPKEFTPFSISNYVSIKQGKNYQLYKKSPFDSSKYFRISTLGNRNIKEYDATATGTIQSLYENGADVMWGNNIDMYKTLAEKGYTPKDVKDHIQRITEKYTAETVINPENIYKICE